MKSKTSPLIGTLIWLCVISAFVGLLGGSLAVSNPSISHFEEPLVCPNGDFKTSTFDNGRNTFTSFFCSVNGQWRDASLRFMLVTALLWGILFFILLLMAVGIVKGVRTLGGRTT